MQTFSDFELRHTVLDNVLASLNAQCPWCGDAKKPLMITLKNHMTDFIKQKLKSPTYSTIQRGLEREFDQFIENFTLADYNWGNLTGLRSRLRRYADVAQDMFTDIETVTMERLQISINLLDEMRATISPYCNDDIKEINEQYDNIHSRMDSILTDIYMFLNDFEVSLQKTIQLYENANKSLDDVARSFDFDLKTAFIQVKRISVDLLLRERVLGVAKIPIFINMLNFWLYAQHKSSYLKDNNLYWKHLGVVDVTPNVSAALTASAERDINQITSVNMPDSVNKFWDKMADDTSVTLKSDLELHFDQMVRAMSDTKTYFTDYLEGNQVNDNFYR